MSEEAKAVQETAKAVQETAKTTPVVIEAGTALARWGARVLGTVPEDLVGFAVGDYLHELRLRNLDSIRRKTEKILEKRGVTDAEPINLKLARPAFEAASEESDEILQDLWANLLANAMDPDKEISIRRILIDTLKQLEPLDALIFERIVSRPNSEREDPDSIQRSLNIRPQLTQVSLAHLRSLGCITDNLGSNTYEATALGFELWLACRGDAEG